MRIRIIPDLLGFVNNVLYFTLPAERRTAVLALVERPQELEPVLAQPFTPYGAKTSSTWS